MRDKRDGQPIPGTAGTITAEQQAAALGLDGAAPKPAPLPLTPAQARRAMSDEWVGDDLDPPDYERSVVTDPDAIAEAFGLHQSDFDPPLGSQPEGQPIAPPAVRPSPDTKASRANWDQLEANRHTSRVHRASDAIEAGEPERQKLRDDFRAHAAKITARAQAAKGTEREAAAVADVHAAVELGRRLKEKVGWL